MAEEGGRQLEHFLFCFVWFVTWDGEVVVVRGVFINWVGQLMNTPNYN